MLGPCNSSFSPAAMTGSSAVPSAFPVIIGTVTSDALVTSIAAESRLLTTFFVSFLFILIPSLIK